jgi:hypothetical protein
MSRHFPVQIPRARQIVYALREQTRPNEEYLGRNVVRSGILQPFQSNAIEANSRLYDPLQNGQWNRRQRTLRRSYY